ncbi:MAG: WG repeat-containing protein [Muribaculaceae bacterium]|nr:WG repeat-containing protein [Muribaculaceae bacterium]
MRYKIKTEEDKIIRIADHDIDVFIIENTVYEEKLVGKKEPKGPYLFGYELGAEYTSDEEVHVTVYERPEPYGNIFMGEGGFASNDLSMYRMERLNHCIDFYDKKGELSHWVRGSQALIRAIVPKGTKYMENEKGVIISNTIKIISVESGDKDKEPIIVRPRLYLLDPKKDEETKSWIRDRYKIGKDDDLQITISYGELHIIVYHNEKYGVIDIDGNEILPIAYDEIVQDHNNHVVIVRQGEKYGCLSDENVFSGCNFDGVRKRSRRYIMEFLKDGRWVLLDKNNQPTKKQADAYYGKPNLFVWGCGWAHGHGYGGYSRYDW